MFNDLIRGFVLGNSAILTNVCLLPLYPGMVAMLAQQSTQPDRRNRLRPFLGLIVLAGVLAAMIAIGAALHGLSLAFADIIQVALPVLYVAVAALGVLTILDRSPFTRMATVQAPVTQRPGVTAFLYGVLLGPMTMPCTGPVVLSAFTIGSVAGNGRLASALAYFVAFGVGFGWPLVVLPMFAMPVQRRLTRFLARHHRAVVTVSGLLLIGVAILGIVTELL